MSKIRFASVLLLLPIFFIFHLLSKAEATSITPKLFLSFVCSVVGSRTMSSDDNEVDPEKPANAEIQTADDAPSSNGTSDDRINPIEKSLTNGSNTLDDSNDFDDMKSLLPASVDTNNPLCHTKSKINSLDIDDGNDEDLQSDTKFKNESCCFGLIRNTRTVGNMLILFPDYYESSGWGVVGPHRSGPVVVWLLLFSATHGVVNGIEKHNLGTVSVVICYLFLAVATYRLTDVCYRDPGICSDKEIPGHEPPERAREYRFCDRCKVWQPPDGVHCPESNVCVAGYDHYCVWMGTCIGKRNYRQFVKFNITVSGS